MKSTAPPLHSVGSNDGRSEAGTRRGLDSLQARIFRIWRLTGMQVRTFLRHIQGWFGRDDSRNLTQSETLGRIRHVSTVTR